MKERGKISKHKILTVLWLSVASGLTKNEFVQSFMEKLGLSIKETAIYQIIEKLTNEEIHFVRKKRVPRSDLSRHWHYRYFLTPEGLEGLIRLNKTNGKLRIHSPKDSPIDVPGGNRTIIDFLSSRPPTGSTDSKT